MLAGKSLWPAQLIDGWGAHVGGHAARQWAGHVLGRCKTCSDCTTSLSFAGAAPRYPCARAREPADGNEQATVPEMLAADFGTDTASAEVRRRPRILFVPRRGEA
ncbi:hypothetical protein DCS_00170 [Drechmeria coniospora]|uniref:Uncharacterized protein n=1 Tax=Drechmeria coniospora TaxID=98403 RepID=A0A151GPM3_DRECN|nr:hypothetical protein DCS_00170 [Drechmeria coniospora]KYK59043.1 hypothetical protein DCS_00170 [Drechmeria coniospora]